MIKKIGFLTSIMMASCLTITALGAELSPQEKICEQYLKSDSSTIPVDVSPEVATALKACADKGCPDALSGIANCTKKLFSWETNYEEKQKAEKAQEANKEKPSVNAAASETTPVATPATSPAAPITPVPVQTQAPVTQTNEYNQPTEKPKTQTETESQPKKAKQPSINWF